MYTSLTHTHALTYPLVYALTHTHSLTRFLTFSLTRSQTDDPYTSSEPLMNLLINQALVCEFLGESSHTALAGRWSHSRTLTRSLTHARTCSYPLLFIPLSPLACRHEQYLQSILRKLG